MTNRNPASIQSITPGQPAPGFLPSLRPQSVTQTPNILIDQARLYSPPELGYYWSWLSIHVPDRVKPALKRATEKSGELAMIAWDAALKGLNATTPDPQTRILLYRRKSMDLWIEQRAKFPWAFLHDWLDMERLEGRLIEMPSEMPMDALGPTIPA